MSKTDDEETVSGNGYLRQGEFRRWAASVDLTLGELTKAVAEHGRALAVSEFRQTQVDVAKQDRTQLTRGVVVSVVGSCFALLIEVWRLFVHK